MLEKQFRNYYEVARSRPGVTGDNLLSALESRLDNVVYRLSFADSRRQARQLVTHGHFTVNDRRMDIPSYLVKAGDTVKWKRVNDDTAPEFVKDLTDGLPKRPVPSWLNLNTSELSGEIVTVPAVDEIDTGIDVRLIVEFYSK